MSFSAARAEVFLLPLAAADPDAVRALGVDPGILCRRIPDFLHQLVNQGEPGPTALVELQAPDDTGEIAWADLREPMDPEEALDLLPEGCSARALVCGTLSAADGELAVDLRVYATEDLDASCTTRIGARLPLIDPASALRRVADRLARLLEIAVPPLPDNLITRSGAAFFAFLSGLDGAALLSGEVDVAGRADPASLLRPLAEAVRLDPGFGIALRVWHVATTSACARGRLSKGDLARLADECLHALPRDGEACVVIAEQLSAEGDDERATAWLRHAVRLDPPPARGLESLGIVLANRGETAAARELWRAGLEQDGHPDFFAHLARLEFACGEDDEAWAKIVVGLRRLRERATRRDEWGDDGRGAGVLLAYLLEHLVDRKPPAAVGEAVRSLADVLPWAEDRIDLGACLAALGAAREARAELTAGLAGELPADVRDRGVRVLLRLKVRNFEARFARAVDAVLRRRNLRKALAELDRIRAIEPRFWLATFYAGVAHRRLGAEETALDLMAEVLRQRPGQPDALTEMAELFDRRGNPKRALECIEDALVQRPADAALLGRRALYQHHLGRSGPARESLRAALTSGRSSPELEEIRRQILS